MFIYILQMNKTKSKRAAQIQGHLHYADAMECCRGLLHIPYYP